MLACLVFFGSYLNHLILVLGGHPVPLIVTCPPLSVQAL